MEDILLFCGGIIVIVLVISILFRLAKVLQVKWEAHQLNNPFLPEARRCLYEYTDGP